MIGKHQSRASTEFQSTQDKNGLSLPFLDVCLDWFSGSTSVSDYRKTEGHHTPYTSSGTVSGIVVCHF